MSDTRTRWILELVDAVSGPSKTLAANVNIVSNAVGGLRSDLKSVSGVSAAVTNNVSSNFKRVKSSIGTSFSGMRKSASDAFGSMKAKGLSAFNSLRAGNKALFAEVGRTFPMLARIGPLITSPLGIAAIAITVIVGTLYKGVAAAKEFDNQFIQLKQLNLDKPAAEIDRLNTKVLDTAFYAGLSAKDTAKAYFDIQSATGKYGAEVDEIVGKVGQFSQVFGAGFDASINGSAKAINAFKLEAKDMDAYLASSFKTVQVGTTTFDQLAQVQTDYAGAAAAAGQGVDDANKLFANFTNSAKSVNEAATLTKTAFQDLTKGATIEGFKSLGTDGVDIFNKDGSMRSLDAIVRDAVPLLQTLSDQDFANLKENIGGSEGIKKLLDQMKTSGNEMIASFDAFNNTEFNLDAAIKNANGDLTILQNIMGNKVNNLFIRLGQSIMPSIVSGVGTLVEWLDKGFTTFRSLYDNSALFRDVIDVLVFGPLKFMWYTFSKTSEISHSIGTAVMGLMGMDMDMGKSMFGSMDRYYQIFKAYMDRIRSTVGNLLDAAVALASGRLEDAKNSFKTATEGVGKKLSFNEIKRAVEIDIKNSKKKEETAKGGTSFDPANGLSPTSTDTPTGSGAGGGGATLQGSGGGGKGGRSITMNLDITNYFNVDGSTDVDAMADKIIGKVNDRLRDGAIALG